MPQIYTRLGTYGTASVPLPGNASPAPLLSAAFALQAEGVPQQFPDVPQVQHIASGNAGFALSVQMLDGNGNPLDISAASAVSLVVTWPGGQVQAIPAAFATNGTDGIVAAPIIGGLGGGWGLYWVSAVAVIQNQTIQTQGGQLWIGWLIQ